MKLWDALAVIALVLLLWVFLPVETIWRCRKCGRLSWGRGADRAEFCPQCGVPRPRGPADASVPLTVKALPAAEDGMYERVTAVLREARVAEALPSGTKAVATIVGYVAPGTAVARAHPTWNPDAVGRLHGLPPYPRRDPSDVVEGRVVRVEIDAVERPSGGMGSHFGFEGLFVSLLLSLDEGVVWDARADAAT